MKKYFICYGDEKFKKARDLCCKKAKRTHFFDVVIGYSPEDLESEWKKKNQEILNVKRGNGLWLWKPYLILKTLESMDWGDFLFYEDSGSFFIRSPKYVYQSMGEDDIWVSDIPLIEKQFTKPSLFVAMNCNNSKYTDTRQIQGTFLGIRKTSRSLKFVTEWLRLCSVYEYIAPEKKNSMHPEYYIAHREDQSILSLQCKKNNIHPHQDPSQYSKYWFVYCCYNRLYLPIASKEYPVSILLYRNANVKLKTIILNYIRIFLPQWIGALLYTQYFDLLRRRFCRKNENNTDLFQ